MHISSGSMRMATGSPLGTCATPSGQKPGDLQANKYNAVPLACWLPSPSEPSVVSSSVQDEEGTPLCTLPPMPPCPSSPSPPALGHTPTISTPEPQRYGISSSTGQRDCTGLHASREAAPAPATGVTLPVTAPAHLDGSTTQPAACHTTSPSCAHVPSFQSYPCFYASPASARGRPCITPCRPTTPASKWPGLATLRTSLSPMLLALTLVLASSCALGSSAAAASAASRGDTASRSRALASSGFSSFPLTRDAGTHNTLEAAAATTASSDRSKAAASGISSGGAREANAAGQRWALADADRGGDGVDSEDAVLREEVQTLRKRLDEVLDAIEKRNSERRSLAAKGKRAKSPKPSKPPKATKAPKGKNNKNQPPPPPPTAKPSPAPRPPSPRPPLPRPPSPRPPSPSPPKKSPPPPDIVNRDDSSPPPPPPALASERSPPPPVRRPPPPRAGAVDIPPAPPQEPTWPPLFPSPPPSPPMRRPPMEVLRAVGEYRQVGISNVVAVHMVHVPGSDKYLFMERPSGYHPFDKNYIAGYYDLAANRWENVFSPDGLFCCGHTLLASGDVVIVGGHQANAGYPDGMKSVRVFDKSTTRLELVKVNEMGWRRWYPTATLLPDGRVLIMGGTQGVGAGTANNPFWELYNPDDNSVTPFAMRTGYLDGAKQVYYPFNYVLPSGLLFTFCGRGGWIVNWQRNEWRQNVPRLRGYATTQFPFTGTSVMLGLYPERGYEVEIMLFGGQNEQATKDITMVASKNAQRLRMAFDAASGNYTFFGDDYDTWVEEPMPRGRVMPDATLLPNGKVVILNGANTGLAGDSSGGGESRADYPVLYAEIYDPDAPQGQRLTRMASTPIARMYHSVAALTTDGTVVVAGCDRCFKFKVEDGVPFSPSPTSKAEYRIEVFSPPYFFIDELKPQVISTQADVMDYGAAFRINYWFPGAYDEAPAAASNGRRGNNGDGAMRLTRAVLVAPSSCTHSYNTNQRLVGLETVSDDPTGGVLVVRGPPSINHAPPGMYMLFLLNGEVYGKAAWVRLPRM